MGTSPANRLWTVRYRNDVATTMFLEVFTQRNFAADFFPHKLNLTPTETTPLHPSPKYFFQFSSAWVYAFRSRSHARRLTEFVNSTTVTPPCHRGPAPGLRQSVCIDLDQLTISHDHDNALLRAWLGDDLPTACRVTWPRHVTELRVTYTM